MNPSFRQAGQSPRLSEQSNDDTFPERHHDPGAAEDTASQYLESFLNAHQDSGSLHGLYDRSHRGYGTSNDFNQYHTADFNFHPDRSALHNRQASECTFSFAPRSDHGLLRGIEDCAEATSPGTHSRELGRREAAILQDPSAPYNMPRRSESVASGSPALHSMQNPPYPSIDSAPFNEQPPARETKYTPFQYHFADSGAARDHRRQGTRFERLPYRDPETDESIAEIENNRNVHVERIYNAMTSGEAAKDNRGSIAMKRWVIEAHYPADLVEAYAHKVFDCLIAQAKYGFRGWIHNDYVADERKGEDIDKDVDCAGRLDNIILALEHEKTICEDVMNSACQIRMFVNAPRAYANRKHQNRVGNSKRGRTKDTPDPNPRPAKSARTGGRRTRARSTTASEMPSSRGTTPQNQQQQTATPGPYYTKAAFPTLSPNPSSASYPPPRSTPLHRPTLSAARSSFGQHSATAMSPPPTSSPQVPHAPQSMVPRMATMPPHQPSPLMSPPPLSHGHYSASASPDEAKPLAENTFGSWQDFGLFAEPSHQDAQPAIDPMLTQLDFTGLPHCEPGEGSSWFDQTPSGYVNMCDIERRPSREFSGNFPDYWSAQPGVHEFPHPDGSSKQQR